MGSGRCSVDVKDTSESDPLVPRDEEQSQQDHGSTQIDLVSVECTHCRV